MKRLSTTFMKSGDSAYVLHTQLLASVPGAVHLQICSRWFGARKPDAEQRKLDVTLGRADLGRLIDGLRAVYELGEVSEERTLRAIKLRERQCSKPPKDTIRSAL